MVVYQRTSHWMDGLQTALQGPLYLMEVAQEQKTPWIVETELFTTIALLIRSYKGRNDGPEILSL